MPCDVFVSYTNLKDLYGAAGKFCEHLEVELRKKTGAASLTVFQDKRNLRGGDKWEDILEAEIASARLFLILLSPSWIRSEWCAREYRLFTSAASAGAPGRSVVPLVWDKVADADAKTPEQKKLLAELKGFQWLTWDELQYADWVSPEPNRAAGRLAEELKPRLGDL